MKALDVSEFDVAKLVFCNSHDAPPWARIQLHDWVWGMQRAQDGEKGEGPRGAGAWLDEKIALSRPSGLFQTFIAMYGQEVVWTGSIVEDDRNGRVEFANIGHPVNAFFGLFNTRHDLRGRGIGWAGANHVARHVWGGEHDWRDIRVGLFTTNPAAERHYTALGFKLVGNVYVSEFGVFERGYVNEGGLGQ